MITHATVLLNEAIGLLRPRPGGSYVDGTVGLGGHAEKILELTEGRARVLAVDWDEDALARARERLARFGDAVTYGCDSFARLPAILEKRNWSVVDGIILDLGLSSLHIEDASRGFSFLREGPLDMRMSRAPRRSAADLLRSLGEKELEEIFRSYGEEPRARRIARAIGRMRGKGTGPERPGSGDVLGSTRALAEFIERLVGRHGRAHPATRVFQALRIAVNDELENLKKFLGVFDKCLGRGGRACVISFHSLEDRLVKRSFLEKKKAGLVAIVTKKPITPTPEECAANPRARSAKLRCCERL